MTYLLWIPPQLDPVEVCDLIRGPGLINTIRYRRPTETRVAYVTWDPATNNVSLEAELDTFVQRGILVSYKRVRAVPV